MKPQPSIHSLIRDRLLTRAGLQDPSPSKFKPSDLKNLEKSEWSPEFERLMRNRLLMGALRYGTFKEKQETMYSKDPWDLLTPITDKVKLYQQTGNTEYLVDAANYLMLAFEFDPHPKKHFEALDDHQDHCRRKSDVTTKRSRVVEHPDCKGAVGYLSLTGEPCAFTKRNEDGSIQGRQIRYMTDEQAKAASDYVLEKFAPVFEALAKND